MNFIDCIEKNIGNETKIKNWSFNGQIKVPYYIFEKIDGNCCILRHPTTYKQVKIAEEEFQEIFKFWDGYCLGKIKRKQLRDMNRYTTYVICVLHYLTENGCLIK